MKLNKVDIYHPNNSIHTFEVGKSTNYDVSQTRVVETIELDPVGGVVITFVASQELLYLANFPMDIWCTQGE